MHEYYQIFGIIFKFFNLFKRLSLVNYWSNKKIRLFKSLKNFEWVEEIVEYNCVFRFQLR